MSNLDYYNDKADDFIKRTVDLDMTYLYDRFLKYVGDGERILDIGCGSGRDSRYFMSQGYDVYAHDGSEAMVRQARSFIGDRAVMSLFHEFDPVALYGKPLAFDAMWACASLLHVPENELTQVVDGYLEFLQETGVFFMSFKENEENFTKDERSFTCFTEERLIEWLDELAHVEVLEVFHTLSVKEHAPDEKWISAIARKKRT